MEITGNITTDGMAAEKLLGVRMQPRITAAEWQEMEKEIDAIVTGKVPGTPWLPDGWLKDVKALAETYPDQRVMINSVRSVKGTRLDNAPFWLDSEEKLTVWQELYNKMNRAIMDFSAGKLQDGLAEMAATTANADFWDALYRADKFIADLPATVIGAAGDFASGVVGSFLKSFWPVLVIGGIVALVWYNKDKLASTAGDKVAGAIKG